MPERYMQRATLIKMVRETKEWLLENEWIQDQFDNGKNVYDEADDECYRPLESITAGCLLGAMTITQFNMSGQDMEICANTKQMRWTLMIAYLNSLVTEYTDTDFTIIPNFNDAQGRTFDEIVDFLNWSEVRLKEKKAVRP